MSLVLTNINIYRAIAEDAYAEMCSMNDNGRILKDDGTGGYVLKYDPEHHSFKNAMVVIVFTGMWLEALLHQAIIKIHGEVKFREVDRSFNYEKKLELIGASDSVLLTKVKKFREARKELVHEKAHFDNGTIKVAQQEATLANEVMREVSKQIP